MGTNRRPDATESTDIQPQPSEELGPLSATNTEVHASPEQAPLAPDGVRRFRLMVIDGPKRGARIESTADRCSLGSHLLNDLILDDPTVSRFHCEILMDESGARVIDLKSRNGTFLDSVHIKEAMLRGGSLLRLGRVVVRFDYDAERNPLTLSTQERFGSLVGCSPAMRAVFALLERAAESDATLLLEGETGTGKGVAAASIHRQGPRKHGPFVVVDCGAIPGNLLESELFGHEKGSFTGAEARRTGAFEAASDGTAFLDEIGELPLELQPKLLRALESKEIRRLGSNRYIPVDVRVICATNRDLRAEVNAGRFRSDLYYRLAVVKVRLPPLRERPEDLPALVEQFLQAQASSPEVLGRFRTPEVVGELARHPWPGNVRELRNYLERYLVFRDNAPPASDSSEPGLMLPYAEARRRNHNEWERAYLEALLRKHDGRVASAAVAAGLDRAYVYKLLRRHGLRSWAGASPP